MGGMVYYRTTEEGAKAPGGPDPVRHDPGVGRQGRQEAPNGSEQTAPRKVPAHAGRIGGGPGLPRPTPARRSSRRIAGTRPRPSSRSRAAARPTASRMADEVDDQYRKPNALVNSDDVRCAAWRNADHPRPDRPLGEDHGDQPRWVHQNVREKNFETAFASGRARWPRSLTGDCTEHFRADRRHVAAAGVPRRASSSGWCMSTTSRALATTCGTRSSSIIAGRHRPDLERPDDRRRGPHQADGDQPGRRGRPSIGLPAHGWGRPGHLTIEPIEIR